MSVNLTAIWLHDAEDLTDAMAFEDAEPFEWDTGESSSVVAYLNRFRAISSRTEQPRSASITLTYLRREQVTWLQDHEKRLLCYRDPYGRRKLWGQYASARVREGQYATTDLSIVSITFVEVTHSEAV